MLPLLLTAAATFALACSPVWDFDVWFQLACGKAIVGLKALPTHDLFSYTAASHPWDTQEWLSQVLLYGVEAAGGLPLLILAKAAVATLTFGLLFRRATDRGADPWLAATLCLVAAFVCRWFLVERPQIFSQALFVVLLWRVERGGPWWTFPLVTVAWANLHGGSVLLVPGLLGVWIAAGVVPAWIRREAFPGWRAPTLALAASLVAVTANPAGWHLFVYPFQTMADRMYMLNVREWIPPAPDEQPEFFAWAVAALVVLTATRRSWRIPDVALSATFAVFAGGARRHIPLVVLTATPLLAAGLSDLIRSAPRPRFGPIGPGLALLAAVGFPAVAAWNGEALGFGVREEWYPAGAIRWLAGATQVPGADPLRLYTLHRWGGYATWHLPPRFKVFIDGRQLVYGSELFLDYYKILENTPDSPPLLDGYAPDLLVLEYGTKLGARLAADPRMALCYWDDAGLLYVRRAGRAAALIPGHEFTAFNPERGPAGRPAAVLADLSRAVDAAPRSARPLVNRALYLGQLGRTAEALADARAAVAIAPRVVPPLLVAAQCALAARDPVVAERYIRQAERLDAGGVGTRLARARLELTLGHREAGARALDRAIAAGEADRAHRHRPDGSLIDAYRTKAAALAAANEPAGAADALRLAGNTLYELGDRAGALGAYDQALKLAPADARLYHNIGSLLEDAGRHAQAATAFERALALGTPNADTLVALGVARYRLGQLPAARRAWQQALVLAPNRDDAVRFLAETGGGVAAPR